MATEIIGFGFTPGPTTKKDLEPTPQPVPMFQIVQQHPNAEKIIFMLGVIVIMLVAVIMLQNLGRAGVA
jgi:hypothetical protein